jgi:S-adenosylmethionine hydrolase
MLVNEAKSQNWKNKNKNTRDKFFSIDFFGNMKKNAMHKETTRKLNFAEKIFVRVLGK